MAIITPTRSGYTSRVVSQYRPRVPIVAFAPNSMVARHLNLIWGVVPVKADAWLSLEEMIAKAAKSTLEHGLVEKGSLTIMTSGIQYGESQTSAIRVYKV